MHSGDSSVELTIQGYQFTGEPSPTRTGLLDDDANWLEVRGVVRDNGTGWSFVDPCLLTVEAQEIVGWLRDVAAGGSPEELSFLEPNLAFAVESRTDDGAAVRVTFSLESAPASGSSTDVMLRMATPELAAAAAEWESELAAYPQR